mgnify:CR=1 FL=1|tara:strand:- start:4915 stop:7140 length:2226 start_codon:yes stop_codon:yes gene_type:complete
MLSVLKRLSKSRKAKPFQKSAKPVMSIIESNKNLEKDDIVSRLLNTDPKDTNTLLAMLSLLSKKVTSMLPFETQISAVLAMLEGNFVEMDTGEGKTLVFSLLSIMYSLSGRRVVVTSANSYLTNRDADFTNLLAKEVGIKVAKVDAYVDKDDRKTIYDNASIIYASLMDISMDYLRYTFRQYNDDIGCVETDVLLIDEADSVLMDKATQPFVLSKPSELNETSIKNALEMAKSMSVEVNVEVAETDTKIASCDALINAVSNKVVVSDEGLEKYEKLLIEKGVIVTASDLYKGVNLMLLPALESAIAATYGFKKGDNYIIDNGEIVPIDEVTGRPLHTKFFGGALQHCLEMKEGLKLSKDMIPFTSVSTQHFVRMFNDVVGMSGTLQEEENEFSSVYGVNVINIPRNRPLARKDKGDVLFLTQKGKLRYTLKRISEAYKRKQPVLIATRLESESTNISRQLDMLAIPHKIIQANAPSKESETVAVAGVPGAITISTSISGRGTDIVLGGEKSNYKTVEEWEIQHNIAKEAGGLFVLCYGRQKTKKLDRQLIGRSGRQGDPGESEIISSLEDEMLEPYNGQGMKKLFISAGISEDEALSNKTMQKALDRAQGAYQQLGEKQRKQSMSLLSEVEIQRQHIVDFRESFFLPPLEFIAFIKEHFGINLDECDVSSVRELYLTKFDEAHLSYRVKVNEILSNIGIRGYAVSNLGVELKNELFRAFEGFITILNEDLENVEINKQKDD